MQWVSGVAKIFVDVQGQLVQLDLKPKGAEGHLIPSDITGSLETLAVNTKSGTFYCQALAIGPLVAAKIKAHYGRETRDDYTDLVYVCMSEDYRAEVRAAARTFRQEWKDCFPDKIMEQDPGLEESIRWALNMPRTPSPTTDQALRTSAGGSGQIRGPGGYSGYQGQGGGYGGGQSGGYGYYPTRSAGQSSTASGECHNSGGAAGGSYASSSGRGASSSTGQSTSGNAPRDGDMSRDGYWRYSAEHNDWYHRHSDGKYSWASRR
ncbi:hypothetical protein EDB81DRAFT_799181 [Dactylonectria macrodidyma]|uniref:Uncharacterized protein n=1 Tax=Dactylonectria macrodidyma TaxID=307937 RepID=A0A9P9EPP1_9HYPO|nr:hypothetical protein EDB81DRAFT_799181 [Dactylonectria macrodidyma]